MNSYTININEHSEKGRILIDLLNLLHIDYVRCDAPKKITRQLTAKEEMEGFLYTSKINASKAFAGKI